MGTSPTADTSIFKDFSPPKVSEGFLDNEEQQPSLAVKNDLLDKKRNLSNDEENINAKKPRTNESAPEVAQQLNEIEKSERQQEWSEQLEENHEQEERREEGDYSVVPLSPTLSVASNVAAGDETTLSGQNQQKNNVSGQEGYDEFIDGWASTIKRIESLSPGTIDSEFAALQQQELNQTAASENASLPSNVIDNNFVSIAGLVVSSLQVTLVITPSSADPLVQEKHQQLLLRALPTKPINQRHEIVDYQQGQHDIHSNANCTIMSAQRYPKTPTKQDQQQPQRKKNPDVDARNRNKCKQLGTCVGIQRLREIAENCTDENAKEMLENLIPIFEENNQWPNVKDILKGMASCLDGEYAKWAALWDVLTRSDEIGGDEKKEILLKFLRANWKDKKMLDELLDQMKEPLE